jgi:hypothetical protein
VRCPDGTCADSAEDCAAGSEKLQCPDPSAPVPCGDGSTCAATTEACIEAISFDGCPVGQFACPANKKECRTDKDDCQCSERPGTSFCGWSRTASGALVRELVAGDDGELSAPLIPVCKETCAETPPNAVEVLPAVAEVEPDRDTESTIEAAYTCPPRSYTDTNTWPLTGFDDCACEFGLVKLPGAERCGTAAEANATATATDTVAAQPRRPVGTVLVPQGSVVSALTGEAVVLAISKVADSDLRAGAFAKLPIVLESAAITVEPQQLINIDPDGTGQGIKLDLAVDDENTADASGGVDDAACTRKLARLTVYSAGNVARTPLLRRWWVVACVAVHRPARACSRQCT